MNRDQLIETMDRALMNVSTPAMNGENLAVLLCAFFDDGGPDVDDCGWSQAALDGYNEVKSTLATAALAALEAAGMRVVPVKHDPTNPFVPRERPKKSIRLMTDAERRTAGLDPNGGFDGPTGAE